jgi:Arc/MetJ-type ribon-helix-helix transcriptional regulator
MAGSQVSAETSTAPPQPRPNVAHPLLFPYSGKQMDLQLTPDQKAFARRAIASGRLQSEEDAVQEALTLWVERERQRAEFLLTLEDARTSFARGSGRVVTEESMRELSEEVKERGRARLLAELTTSR